MQLRYEYYKKKKKHTTLKRFSLYLIKLFIITLLITLFVNSFLFRTYRTLNNSMSPVLKSGTDHFIVSKIVYGIKFPFTEKRSVVFRKIKRNDIVLLKHPHIKGERMVRRIIAIPGDFIEIRDKKIILNGKEIVETFVRHSRTNIIPGNLSKSDNMDHVRIEQDNYFVIGDNRDESYDSRWFGPVNKNLIIGKVSVRHYPLKRFSRL
ncbi:MAG: signal peptidase I [Actinomycetia bacterium]|nr:signal peptidase I [Actinomycetes bacterium]